MSLDPAIVTLCGLLGVETEYVDNAGQRRQPPEATLVTLLAALGYPSATADEASASIERFRLATVARLLDPVAVCRDDKAPPAATVSLPAAAREHLLRWELMPEVGEIERGATRFADLPLLESLIVVDKPYERRRLALPTLPLGYHRLRIDVEGITADGMVIVVPRKAYQVPELESGPGIWGLAVQLYGLRRERDWGIGDLTSLGNFLRHAAAAGAGAVGLNPLHALFPDDPWAASPYSPSSRLFANVFYLDVEAIEDFSECLEAQITVATAEWQAALRRSRAGELVDYGEVAECKLRVVELLYRSFCHRHMSVDDARGQAFRTYQAREGPALQSFAVFQALREHLAKTQAHWQSWHDWPVALRDPASREVGQFAAENAERIAFFAYLQWQYDAQFAHCGAVARQLGMPVGIYNDLAVGVDANGADAWLGQDAIVSGWSIGAPPDAWAPKGQAWGLPPFDPIALRALAFRPLVEMFRANMRHAGALRIDHILSLRRLFWIPAGGSPADGAYVRYPFDEMVGILALESQRHRCLIIGEDLGTLPVGFRDALAETGILSYRLLYFERDANDDFRQPDAYPRQALVAIGTHDLPTLPAYWAATDLALRSRLGGYENDAQRSHEEQQRHHDCRRLAEALRGATVLEGADPTADAPPVEAAYRFLARTPSRILMVHLEDALGVHAQINVPGTVAEHPNWRRRLPLATDDLFRDPRVRHLLNAMVQERPPPDRGPAR